MHRAMFLKKIGSGTHSDTKFCRRRGVIMSMREKKKVPDGRSGLRPSEKEVVS
jgi:hypothetical protein